MKLPLKIGILSFVPLEKKAAIGELMLKRTAKVMGHSARIFRNAHFQLNLDRLASPVLYKGGLFQPPDVMIIRANLSRDIDLETSTVKHFQLLGIPVVNKYLPIVRAKNKVRTLQILSHEKIPVPKTAVIHNLTYIDSALAHIGSFPVIIKTPRGTQGIGVSIIESSRSLRSMLDFVAGKAQDNQIIIQEYVKEAKGKDIRVFIVGGKIIAAMERKARRGEFRSNFHRGGSVSLADLTEEEKNISLKSVRAIGLDIAGVDIIRTGEGPKILEVNACPGLEGITKATGIDVAGQIIRFAEKMVKQQKWLIQKEDLVTAA